jgi:hypothetical protein
MSFYVMDAVFVIVPQGSANTAEVAGIWQVAPFGFFKSDIVRAVLPPEHHMTLLPHYSQANDEHAGAGIQNVRLSDLNAPKSTLAQSQNPPCSHPRSRMG